MHYYNMIWTAFFFYIYIYKWRIEILVKIEFRIYRN